jgi:hypothetical protein
LSIGVPQGTILGPILFVIFVNDFSSNLGPVIAIRYADDTSIIAVGKIISEVQSKLQAGTDKAIEWLNNNRLFVNDKKSTCMLIGTRHRLANLKLEIYISGNVLENCQYIKLLGVYIDCYLTWDKHTEYLCRKLSNKNGILYRYSKFLPKSALDIVYNTLIQPDIDYGLSIWGHCALIYLNRVQKMQNRCVRIISNNFDWSTRTNVLLSELGFMSISTRRDYFAGNLMFKTIMGYGLHYLSLLLTFTSDYHNYNTRASVNNRIVLNKPNCELYKTSLIYYGSHLWNSLPDYLKSSENIYAFKSNFKLYLLHNVELEHE